MNLLDIISAQDAADEAIARVGVNADPKWLNAAHGIITELAFDKQRFTSDDVWAMLDKTGVPNPHEPRALGAVLKQVAKEGLIHATDDWVPSRRAVAHARPVRVWVRCQYLPEE